MLRSLRDQFLACISPVRLELNPFRDAVSVIDAKANVGHVHPSLMTIGGKIALGFMAFYEYLLQRDNLPST